MRASVQTYNPHGQATAGRELVLVFQYGSNASTERLNDGERLGGAAVPVGLARTVAKYRLAFTHWSKTNQCGTADLVPDEVAGRVILGVVYEIAEVRIFRGSESQTKTLDEIEGEGSAYERTDIEVVMPGGRPTRVLTYVVLTPGTYPTSVAYVRHIIFGLWQQGTPLEYLDYVVACASEASPELAESFRDLISEITGA